MSKVIVLASINMDITVPVDSAPNPGQTVIGGDVSYIPGGKGLNQALASNRMKAPTAIIGTIGRDSFGKDVLSFLKSQKFTKLIVSKSKKPTGVAMIMVSKDGENVIAVSSGANTDTTLKSSGVSFSDGDVALATLEVPQKSILALFKKAKERKVVTILNAAPALQLEEGIIEYTDILCVNETELSFYINKKVDGKNKKAITIAAQKLAVKTNTAVLVTLGKTGIVYADPVYTWYEPVFKVKAADTTGAGDCFTGAFAALLAQGKSIRDAIHLANAASALKVQRFGASNSPQRSEVLAFVKRYEK